MIPRRPQALLFDLDDTLWPIGPVIAAAEQSWHAWLAERAPEVTARYSIAELRARRLALLAEQPALGIDLYRVRELVLADVFAELGADAAHLDGAMAHFTAARNAVTLYDDVLPVLPELKSLLRLGVITNGNADLEVIGLHHHFEVALSSARFGRSKPDPSIFLSACAAMGVAPEHAIYVGDDLRLDVAGAQSAGMRAVWLKRAGAHAELDPRITPDAICADFHQLLAWIKPLMAE